MLLDQQNHFNSHPHEEDDENLQSVVDGLRDFNSHPHEEDDSNFKQNQTLYTL